MRPNRLYKPPQVATGHEAIRPRGPAAVPPPLRLALPYRARAWRSIRYLTKRIWWSAWLVPAILLLPWLYLVIGLISMRRLGGYLITAGLKLQKYPW